MFQLLANIFHQHDNRQSDLPDSLIDMAIERAVTATDPRMRIVPNYKKRLRQPVIHAIRHVVALVDNLPPPIAATKQMLDDDPLLSALLYSAERMTEIFASQLCVKTFRSAAPSANKAFALLMVEYSQKQTFGYALIDDKPVSDVAKTTVNFSAHRLLDPAESETELRRLLKHRSFDHLLSIALAQIAEQQDERDQLALQRSLLRSKAEIIQRNGGGFAAYGDIGNSTETLGELQQRLQIIEQKLLDIGPVHEVFEKNLQIVVDLLTNAEQKFWLEPLVMRLDRYYVLHEEKDAAVAALLFQRVCDSHACRIVRLVEIIY